MPSKTSVSDAGNYQDIGAFWDSHDATDCGEQAHVDFDVNITSQRRYFALDNKLSFKLKQIAEQRGISEETLLNLWIQEKIDHNLTCGST